MGLLTLGSNAGSHDSAVSNRVDPLVGIEM